MGSTESTHQYRPCSMLSIPTLNLESASDAEIITWLERNFKPNRRMTQMIACLRDPVLVVRDKSYFASSNGLCLTIIFYDPRSRTGIDRLCHLREK